MLSVAAGGVTFVALGAIYKSWRDQASTYLYLGLIIWLVSAVCWSIAQGWEFGVLYTLCMPAILVWPFIALNQAFLPKPKNVPEPRGFDFARHTVFVNAANYFVVLVVLLVVSVLITLGMCALLPFSIAGQLATGTVLLPILWGLIVYHYLATAHKFKVIGAYAALSVTCVPLLVFLPM
ncbi:hypothetical protein D1814_18740 [Alteromonas sp. BL110]|uniref:hypothetical protein n=1 Tax=Alteromonas sp. BL110 TaxID=1714845 RepID=UPI000E47D8CA|nr:hypothetical protein [Alteromonas sp. BL110]AXT40577.1 hypothetical protein D1814_18740 [Alteromonas sp. BL110]RKM79813.1 hypothetical protein D7031_12735 [Alteromonas sp. BL110]